MQRPLGMLVCALLLIPGAVAAQTKLEDNVNQAVTILERFREIPEKAIPEAVMRDAKGLAILTVLKAGFLFSGQGGLGLVVARTTTGRIRVEQGRHVVQGRGAGWSGPSAIATGGAGFGFQVGAEVTEYVMVLNTDEAVKAFSRGGNVTLGGDLSVAAGPVGRTASAAVTPVAAIYSYSRSKGLFAGVSVTGTVIVARNGANKEYYSRKVTPEEILSGQTKPPASALKLQEELAKF
ncbi:MAG TPA: YSC84-related protein [Candidatus Binatia bacterium]|nr:YSC84-related protein [Candidatus Binatia bacterium]